MSVCLIILFETAINTYEYIYNKSLNMCLLNCQISYSKKKKKKKIVSPSTKCCSFLSQFDVTCIFTCQIMSSRFA